jgi:hypothetical protein
MTIFHLDFELDKKESSLKTVSNTVCSRQVGLCAIYEHFSGFRLILQTESKSRPLAANASR